MHSNTIHIFSGRLLSNKITYNILYVKQSNNFWGVGGGVERKESCVLFSKFILNESFLALQQNSSLSFLAENIHLSIIIETKTGFVTVE